MLLYKDIVMDNIALSNINYITTNNPSAGDWPPSRENVA